MVADRLECINHVLLSVEAEPSPEKEKPKLKTKTYEKELGRLQIELVKLQE